MGQISSFEMASNFYSFYTPPKFLLVQFLF